jgi:hypothetical protein
VLPRASSTGNSTADVKFPNSDFFFLPKGIPQLLASVASVSEAVEAGLEGTAVFCEEPEASGDGRGLWYEVVLRLWPATSGRDCSGDGVTGDSNGLPSLEDAEEATACSFKAVVADALDCEVVTVAKVGMRPTENREVVERREAREPGRNGDGKLGTLLWLFGAEPVLFVGDGGGGGDNEGVRLFTSGIGSGGGRFSEIPSGPAEA